MARSDRGSVSALAGAEAPSNGAKVQVSAASGAGNSAEVATLLGQFLRLGLLLSLGLSALALVVIEQLPLASPELEAARLSQCYAAFRSLGIPLVVGVSALAQYRQGLGDSRAAMHAALFANIVNAPLNALFIFHFGWGVAGAALATVCARLAELTVLLRVVRSSLVKVYQGGEFSRRSLPDGGYGRTWELFRFAAPAAVERWLDGAAFAALVLLLGRMGAVQVATHQIVMQLAHLSLLPTVAICEALGVLVAQAAGAGEWRLIRRVGAHSFSLCAAYSLAVIVVVGLFHESLLRLFTSDEEILRAARPTLVAGAALLVIHVPYGIGKAILRGLSDLRYAAIIVVACAWVFTPPLTYVFGVLANLGAAGAWWALCVETSVGAVLLGVRIARLPHMRGRAAVTQSTTSLPLRLARGQIR